MGVFYAISPGADRMTRRLHSSVLCSKGDGRRSAVRACSSLTRSLDGAIWRHSASGSIGTSPAVCPFVRVTRVCGRGALYDARSIVHFAFTETALAIVCLLTIRARAPIHNSSVTFRNRMTSSERISRMMTTTLADRQRYRYRHRISSICRREEGQSVRNADLLMHQLQGFRCLPDAPVAVAGRQVSIIDK